MVACELEYRRRFWMITLVYVLAYAFYNLDHLNILYAIVPGNHGVTKRHARAILVCRGGAAGGVRRCPFDVGNGLPAS